MLWPHVFLLCRLLEVVSGQGHHASSWNRYVLPVGCDWGHINIVVWQAVDHFQACLSRTTNDCNASVHSFASERGCWRREIAVPWKDHFAVVELGLWSILSMADVVKTLLRIFWGADHLLSVKLLAGTVPHLSSIMRVYEMLIPRCDNLSTNSLFRV